VINTTGTSADNFIIRFNR